MDRAHGALRQPDPCSPEQPGRAAAQRYFRLVGRRAACWHGDTPQSEKRRIVADPPDCLLTTPESLEVILVSTKIDHRQFLPDTSESSSSTSFMHSQGTTGVGICCRSSPASRRLAGRDIQRVGLSATVGNPTEMLEWLSCGSDRPREVIQPPPSDRKEPEVQSTSWARSPMPPRSSGYCTKARSGWSSATADPGWKQLALLLREQRVETFVSHSSLGVEERRLAEQAFAQRQNCVIVATSSLELGIDVGDLDRVIQIDAPATVSSFLQRMGRTGRRAGSTVQLPVPGDERRSPAAGRCAGSPLEAGVRRAGRRPSQAIPHPGSAVDGIESSRSGASGEASGSTGWIRSRPSGRWTDRSSRRWWIR